MWLDRNFSSSFQFPDLIYMFATAQYTKFHLKNWKKTNKQKNWKSTFTCWFDHSSMSKANSISINDSEHISHVCYINIGWYCHMQTVVQTMPTQLHTCFGVWKRMLWCSARPWKSHVIYFPYSTTPIFVYVSLCFFASPVVKRCLLHNWLQVVCTRLKTTIALGVLSVSSLSFPACQILIICHGTLWCQAKRM